MASAPAPLRAAIYCRISQDRDGTALGVERQRADCEKLARGRGWEIGATYIDNDVSAYSGKRRPEYLRLLDDMKIGSVQAVVAWHPDRLHRNVRELLDFIEPVRANGIAVATVTAGDFDLTTPTGQATATTISAWAQHASAQNASRIARKHEELAAKGYASLGGTRAFGMTEDRQRLVHGEATLIREACSRVLSGDSLRGICTDWQRRGIKTSSGGRWQQQVLRRMLMSGRIAGVRELGGNRTQGQWPAIISTETLDQVRAVLSDPSRLTRTRPSRKYLLSGFLRCGACRRRMTARPRADHVRRYVCSKGPDTGGCGKTFIVSEGTEQLVEAMVLVAIDEPVSAALAPLDEDATIRAARAEIAKSEKALARLAVDHYSDERITRIEFFAARDDINARIERNRKVLQTDERQRALASVAGGAAQRWPNLSFDARRSVIAAVVDHVTIGPGRRGYNQFDPTRVAITWRT